MKKINTVHHFNLIMNYHVSRGREPSFTTLRTFSLGVHSVQTVIIICNREKNVVLQTTADIGLKRVIIFI